MKSKVFTILALLCLTVTSARAEWNGETYTATANETINGPLNVSTATLTIDEGVTVTVNNGIVISGVLTIKGSGTLKVYGSGGSGIVGNGDGNGGGSAFKGTVNIYSGNVTARGGNGAGGAGGADHYSDENGAAGGDGGQGGEGGAAFEGTVIIYGGTVTATGGNGGNGGWGGCGARGNWGGDGGDGGWGGNGGTAFNGTVTIYGGTVAATGGSGGEGNPGGMGGQGYYVDGNEGSGGSGGNGGYAFKGELTFYGGNVTVKGGNGGQNSDNTFRGQNEAMYGYVSFKAETYEIVDGNNQSITWQQLLESKYAEISATDTECMNITANLAGGAYWTTFYHKEKDFIAPMGTQVFIVKLNSTTKEITLAEIPNRIVKSDEAVVLKQPTTGSEAKNTIVMAKIAANSYGDFSGNSLHGTIAAVSHLINVYVLNNGSHGVGFYKISNQGTLGANKGYLIYTGTSAPEFFGFDNGEATSVSEELSMKFATPHSQRENEEFAADTEWYTLDGRKLSQKPTQKGVYIVNGHKVAVK